MEKPIIEIGTPRSYNLPHTDVVVFAVLELLLLSTTFVSFPAFVLAAQIFRIVIYEGVFLITWLARKYLDNSFFLIYGIGDGFGGFFAILVTLTNPAMGLFTNASYLTNQFLTINRYLLSVSYILALFYTKRKINTGLCVAVYICASATALLLIVGLNAFPPIVVEGSGTTLFGTINSYIVTGLYLVMVAGLARKRAQFDHSVFWLLEVSWILPVVGAFLIAPSGSSATLPYIAGQLIVLWAFFTGYKAILQTGIVNPFANLFRANREKQEALQRSQEDLQRTLERLARSNQDLETFAYAASHDLQEPLRTISSFVQLLSQRYQGKIDADADKYINLVTDGANRMSAMITDLLEFSRIQSQGASFTIIDLNQVLRDALTNLGVTIKESSATVSYDSLPLILGDASQLTQLFQNLIGNGIKYHKISETPLIHVGVTPEEAGNDIHFYVRDNGIGIESKHIEKLFVIFHRLHARDQYPGTGVGLAICKKIVERHGGRIWVESEPGKGSTFHFTLHR